jgi:hypothetical protein
MAGDVHIHQTKPIRAWFKMNAAGDGSHQTTKCEGRCLPSSATDTFARARARNRGFANSTLPIFFAAAS